MHITVDNMKTIYNIFCNTALLKTNKYRNKQTNKNVNVLITLLIICEVKRAYLSWNTGVNLNGFKNDLSNYKWDFFHITVDIKIMKITSQCKKKNVSSYWIRVKHRPDFLIVFCEIHLTLNAGIEIFIQTFFMFVHQNWTWNLWVTNH